MQFRRQIGGSAVARLSRLFLQEGEHCRIEGRGVRQETLVQDANKLRDLVTHLRVNSVQHRQLGNADGKGVKSRVVISVPR